MEIGYNSGSILIKDNQERLQGINKLLTRVLTQARETPEATRTKKGGKKKGEREKERRANLN
jgi:hypothetical protein